MKTRNAVAMAMALIIGYLAYLVMQPFFIPVLWGVIFVILFYPYYLWLLRLVKRRYVASFIACLTVAVFMVAPMVYAGVAISGEIVKLLHWAEEYIKAGRLSGAENPLGMLLEAERFVGRYVDIDPNGLMNVIKNGIGNALGFLGFGLGGALKNVAGSLFNIVLSFLTMFFLFKDGDHAIGALRDILPISEDEKDAAFKRMRTVLSATFYGGILIGVLEGLILGAVFYFLGLSLAALLGFAVFIAAFVPVVSTAVIWAPAAIYFYAVGNTGGAIIVIVAGVTVMIVVDQLLRQAVVSSRTKLHPLLLFFSVLGAVNVFGVIGIIAGPVILCAAGAVLDMYRGFVRGNKRV